MEEKQYADVVEKNNPNQQKKKWQKPALKKVTQLKETAAHSGGPPVDLDYFGS